MNSPWPIVQLNMVLSHRKEFITLDDLEVYKRCRVQLHAKGIVLRDNVVGLEVKTKRQQVCHTNDFLVAEIDAKLGGFGIVPRELDGAIVSSHYFLFDINEELLDQDFLGYFLRTPDFINQVSAQGSTNYAAIRPQDVLEYTVPLPPIDEQRRIVARIEELAARIEEARGLRQQAVEEAEALLGAETDRILGHLARSNWCILDELSEIRGGIQKSRSRIPNKNPRRYLTVAHVQRNRIDTDDPRYFEVTDQELEKWRLLEGDVLVVEGNGSSEQIGRTAVFRGEIEDCVHQNHIIRIRPDNQRLLPDYLNLLLNSPVGQREMKRLSRTSSGLFHLSVGRIASLSVPLLPVEEQHQIITYLTVLEEHIDDLKRLQSETSAELDALLPSILDKAFRGELLPPQSITLAEAFGLSQRQLILADLMLSKQRISGNTSILVTTAMKHAFLLEKEGNVELPAEWYPFRAYMFGPFSKEVYVDLDALERAGFITQRRERHHFGALNKKLSIRFVETEASELEHLLATLPTALRNSTHDIAERYGYLNLDALLDYVYEAYPEYATNTERPGWKNRRKQK